MSTVKRKKAELPRLVVIWAEYTLVCVSAISDKTSLSTPTLSKASTSISTGKNASPSRFQSTLTILSLGNFCLITLSQSWRWMATPFPRVTKPTIFSPGIGRQHFENLAKTLFKPATVTKLLLLPGGLASLTDFTFGAPLTPNSCLDSGNLTPCCFLNHPLILILAEAVLTNLNQSWLGLFFLPVNISTMSPFFSS